MDKRLRWSELAYPVVVTVVLLAITAGARFGLGERLPAQALTVMVGASAMGLACAVMSVDFSTREARTSRTAEATAAPMGVPGLELLYELTAPAAPLSIKVTHSVGECPRGLKIGDPPRRVGTDGHLSAPLCRTAAMAIEPLLLSVSGEENGGSQVSCICPLAGRHLTFAVRRASSASIN